MSSSPATLRNFWDQLPTPGRWLLGSTVFQVLGRGLTLPFTIIYLHEVRDFSLDVAGALMALIGAVALVLTPLAGYLTDHWGARRMVIIGSLAQSIGVSVLAFAETLPIVIVGITFIGICQAGGWSAFNVLISSIVEGPTRQQYFGINFALINLGIGLGGVVGGIWADVDRPETFTAIFLVDAACMLIPVALMMGPLREVHGRSEAPTDETAAAPTHYWALLRRPGVAHLVLISLVFAFVGYGQMEGGFPAYARGVSEVSTRVIGWAFALNTLVIVCFQFFVLRRMEGHRRTRVMVVMAGLWALAWLALGFTAPVAGTAAAVVLVMGYHAVFAMGETMLQPTLPAITNDLAPAHLRGRYNALTAGAFQVGAVVAPLSAGFLLRHDLGMVFIGTLLVGCGLLGLSALRLERKISPAVNGLSGGPVSLPPEPPVPAAP
ncbi:MFS transporter [Nocardioides daejeonensis]|uniref:MFS transporter n=1 Tax=Nocardioides daejeonensis TaxID=1046556 RepID=UPI00194F4890|nr:MFS transporter [Nocardioides daejeonensis]